MNNSDKNYLKEGGKRLCSAFDNQNASAPKVSIVTVTLNVIKDNREASFRQMMDSVSEQSCDGGWIEHVIIDGHSKDGTLELIKEYEKAGKIDYWCSAPDGGIYEAMNKGWKVAQGQYINFLNTDDYFLPGSVNEIISAIEQDGSDYGFGAADFVDESGAHLRICHPKIDNVFFHTPYCHQTLFTKRECLQRVGGFDESYRVCADWLFMLQLYLLGFQHSVIEKNVVVYRVAGQSTDENAFNEDALKIFSTYAHKLNICTSEIEKLRKLEGNYESWRLIINKVLASKNKELVQSFVRGCLDFYFYMHEAIKARDNEQMQSQRHEIEQFGREMINDIQDELRKVKENRWYKFGELSRNQKIWVSGRYLSKKLGVYALLRQPAVILRNFWIKVYGKKFF